MREMNVLSQMMVSDRLQGSSHNTLKYDDTTKRKEHWVEVSAMLQGSSHNTLKYDGTTKRKEHWVESS